MKNGQFSPLLSLSLSFPPPQTRKKIWETIGGRKRDSSLSAVAEFLLPFATSGASPLKKRKNTPRKERRERRQSVFLRDAKIASVTPPRAWASACF